MLSHTLSQVVSRMCGLSILLLCAASCVAATQEGNPPPRGVNIPDPTPRPTDIRKEYDNDPARAKKEKEFIALRNELRSREIWLDVNKIVFYAQELKAEVSSPGKGTPTVTNSAKAADIEKLAKEVKEKLKER